MNITEKIDKYLIEKNLKSKGFNPDDVPYEIKPEWNDFPIVKSILDFKRSVK